MSNIRLRLPDSLYKKVRQLVKEDNTSINQFISSAVAEKISALLTPVYIEKRQKKEVGENFRRHSQKLPMSSRLRVMIYRHLQDEYFLSRGIDF